jgi:hypothetical protein
MAFDGGFYFWMVAVCPYQITAQRRGRSEFRPNSKIQSGDFEGAMMGYY